MILVTGATGTLGSALLADKRRLILPVRIPGSTGRDFRAGLHLVPGHTQGQITFEDFLARRFK